MISSGQDPPPIEETPSQTAASKGTNIQIQGVLWGPVVTPPGFIALWPVSMSLGVMSPRVLSRMNDLKSFVNTTGDRPRVMSGRDIGFATGSPTELGTSRDLNVN